MSNKQMKELTPAEIERKIYERLPDRFPDWINMRKQGLSLWRMTEGVISMLARDKYNDKYIADFWACPVQYVYAIKRTRAKEIEEQRKEYAVCVKIGKQALIHTSTESTELIESRICYLLATIEKLNKKRAGKTWEE